ncbi:MAG: ATP-binding protein, partial [Candidatus Brocadiales bacterium]|nr:ATP-binding protein [Candidatus Bathyanammoxibius amoris]
CISLIPIVLISTLGYIHARRTLKEETLNWLTAVAESRKAQVLEFMEVKSKQAVNFGSDGFIRDKLETINGKGFLNDKAVIALNKHLSLEKMPLDTNILAIEILGMNGTTVASTNELMVGRDVSDDEIFKQGIHRKYNESYISQPHNSPVLKMKSIDVSIPITSRRGTDTIGVLVNHYDASTLNELTASRAGMGETGEVVLVRREGDNIVFLNSLRHAPDAPYSLSIPVDSREAKAMRLALEGESGTLIAPDYRDVTVLAAYQDIPSLGWGLVVKIDESEAFAPVKMVGIFALIVGLISVAAVISVAFFFAASTSRPIRRLTDVTRRFAGGDLKHRAVVNRGDEIGVLARSFNAMADTIEGDIKEIKNGHDHLNIILANIGCLVRVIDPETHKVSLQNDPFWELCPDGLKHPCYTFWGRESECERCVCREAVKDNAHRHKEELTPDGKIYEVHAFPLPNPDGSVTRAIEVIRDVTARRKMEADLEETRMQVLQAQKMSAIGSLSSGVAHSINNPLSGINMFSDLLLKKTEEIKDSALHKEFKDGLTEIREAARRCSNVTKDLLRISRMPKPAKEPVYINEILQHTLGVFVPQLKLLKIKLVEKLSPTIPHVLGSSNQLETVFMNIISNGVDAMPEGGTLTIKSRYVPKEEKVQVSITDTGSGITKQDLQYVMNPYFTTKPPGKGTGIGLSSAQLTIQSHRGTIEIESEVGKGTTVKVTLPITKPPPSVQGGPATL